MNIPVLTTDIPSMTAPEAAADELERAENKKIAHGNTDKLLDLVS